MKFKNICYDLELLGFIDVILITLLDSWGIPYTEKKIWWSDVVLQN